MLAPEVTAIAQEPQKQEKKVSKAELRRQKKAEEEARQIFVIDSILKIRRFTFIAERAMTSLASQPYVTLNYRAYISVDGTKVESQLPYYGNTYTAKISTSKSPLEFKAVDVSYQTAPMTNKKNGKAFILVKAKEDGGGNTYNLGFEIFDNGQAVLGITMREGSGQTFYGWIEPYVEIKKD